MGGNIAFGRCADSSHRLRPLVVEAGGSSARSVEPVEVEVKATNPDEAEYEAYQLIQNLRKVDITVREMIDIAEVG